MKVIVTRTSEDMSKKAAEIFAELILKNQIVF